MDKKLNEQPDSIAASAAGGYARAPYRKPTLAHFGRVVDLTGGLSLPALESGDPENRSEPGQGG